ncbi:MAG: radical SAM protein [Candidatus Altiarchaeales archaeon]|nr:radical SAM protein [Candidatus Altiarchaeales archaeon]MBD3417015.1 radical SAM protein [Candidatus Altiarchaeales archaeon]
MENLLRCENNVRKGFTKDFQSQMKYFNEGKLYTVEIGLTSFCDGGCNYCYAESTPENVKQLSDEKIFEIIDDLVELDVKQVNWGGGEPLARDNWYEIMSYSKYKGLTNLLMTNGAYMKEIEDAKKVNEIVDLAHIHIDTLDKEIHYKTHECSDGYLENQINGLENLMGTNFGAENIALAITVTDPIIRDKDYVKTIDWAYDEKNISVILYPYRAFGLAKESENLSPKFERMWDVYKYRNSKDSVESGPGFGTKFYCGTKCVINYHGDVLGCSMVYSTYAGNVNKQSFKKIFSENKEKLLYEKLHSPETISGHCSKCEKNNFCWGCRAASELIEGDYCKSDPICWMSKEDNILINTSP